jgi:dTDP-glucose 4,6-dehydratase
MTILATGGCGFIGTNFILDFSQKERVVNLDLLTYAGNGLNLAGLPPERHRLVKGDIRDADLTLALLSEEKPRAIVHFAAESHVDRSILGPSAFIETNVVGTFKLLEAARAYHESLSGEAKEGFRFLLVSTDEVYGSLKPMDAPFTELSPYAPNSPYSASKAAADHLGRAYFKTYGLPVITSNCSNNYGPYQFPEKLIPLMILNALNGKALPVYGDGLQVRDWLHVEDHARALGLILSKGVPGETYNIGGNAEKTNLSVVRSIVSLMDKKRPLEKGGSRENLITYVKDRPGHDRRYAVDSGKIKEKLGFEAKRTFEEGLEETVDWYLNNEKWTSMVTSGAYKNWIKEQYGERDS